MSNQNASSLMIKKQVEQVQYGGLESLMSDEESCTERDVYVRRMRWNGRETGI